MTAIAVASAVALICLYIGYLAGYEIGFTTAMMKRIRPKDLQDL